MKNHKLEKHENKHSAVKDKINLTQKDSSIAKEIKKANLTGKFDKIEILDPEKLVKLNMERQKIEQSKAQKRVEANLLR